LGGILIGPMITISHPKKMFHDMVSFFQVFFFSEAFFGLS